MSEENQQNPNLNDGANTERNTQLPEALRRNLWQPGQSGNPSGRPKKKHITEAYERMLEQKLSDPVELQNFIEATWRKLLSDKVVSSMTLEKVLDRTEGKLTQPVDVSGTIDIGQILEKWRNAEEPDR